MVGKLLRNVLPVELGPGQLLEHVPDFLTARIGCGRGDALVRRERNQVLVHLGMLGDHPAAEFLDLLAGCLRLCQFTQFDFGEAAIGGLGNEAAVGGAERRRLFQRLAMPKGLEQPAKTTRAKPTERGATCALSFLQGSLSHVCMAPNGSERFDCAVLIGLWHSTA